MEFLESIGRNGDEAISPGLGKGPNLPMTPKVVNNTATSEVRALASSGSHADLHNGPQAVMIHAGAGWVPARLA